MNIKSFLRRLIPVREKVFEQWREDRNERDAELFAVIRKSGEEEEKRVRRQLLAQAFSAVPEGRKRIVYLGEPTHSNLGDLALFFATRRFVRKQRPDAVFLAVPDRDYFELTPVLRNLLRPDDILILPPGGNFGNVYEQESRIRRSALMNFPENRIILFPQTFHVTCDAAGMEWKARARALCERCPNLTLFAREKASFDKMREAFPSCRAELVPDMVLSTDFRSDFCLRRNVLCILRSDLESALPPLERATVRGILLAHAQITETDMLTSEDTTAASGEALDDKLNEFRHAKLVVTDRLHGMIFSAVTGTPCLVFGNYNHKLRSSYDSWIAGNFPNIRFVENAEELETLAPEWLKNPPVSGDPAALTGKYAPLAACLEE